MSQTECKKTYGPVSPRMLCAGVPSGERDACRVSPASRASLRKWPPFQCMQSGFCTLLRLARGIRAGRYPVRCQAGAAGSWSVLLAGVRAAADLDCPGSMSGSASSRRGSKATSADSPAIKKKKNYKQTQCWVKYCFWIKPTKYLHIQESSIYIFFPLILKFFSPQIGYDVLHSIF